MSISNTVSLATDLNVTPYYDDFDESKNFHRILYRPGLAVQARELTQMQSIMQNQIDRFAEHIFKEGTPVRGLQFLYENDLQYVKINDNDTTGADANTAAFVGTKITGSTSGITALVEDFKLGSEAGVPNTKTLYVKYTRGLANTTNQFLSGETLTSNASINCVVVTQNSTSGDVVGTSSKISFKEGVLFTKDHFVRVGEQSTILGRYDANTNLRVGFDINETIRQQENDTTLLDPAQGSYNYAAPGADRLQITANLVSKPLTTAGITSANTSNNFVEMVRINNGIVTSKYNDTDYAILGDSMARRTFDESGNYIVNGLTLRPREHLKSGTNQGVFTSALGGNTDTLSIDVNPGKAYVDGYENELLVSQHVQIDKGIDTIQIDDHSTPANYGNFQLVKEVVGNWDLDGHDQVSLRNARQKAISNSQFSSAGPAGAEIGKARLRAIEFDSGSKGSADGQYKFYLYDVRMSGAPYESVRSIHFSGGTVNAHADIVQSANASIVDSEFNYGLFDLGSRGVKSLRDASGNKDNEFRFYKSFNVTIATDGTFSIATGASDEQFPYSAGSLNSTQEKEGFHIVVTGTANSASAVTTGSMANGANTVTSVTGASTKYNEGDVIRIAGYSNTFTISSVGSTTLSTFEDCVKAAGLSSANITKAFNQGQVLSLNGVGGDGTARSATVASATSTSFDIQETLNQTLSARVITELKKVDGQEIKKTINKNRLVQIHISNNVTGNTGPWNLGLSDGHKLNSVRFKTSRFTATSQGVDVTSDFELDSGMTDNLYDHSKLKKRADSSRDIQADHYYLVDFDFFTHDTSQGVGYFSVNSYPIDDVITSNTNAIQTSEIPLYRSDTDGKLKDLRNFVDFRPRITDTANSVTNMTNIAVNPITSTTIVEPSGGLRYVSPNEDFTTDFNYYLPRKDRIILDNSGTGRVIRGTPSLNPQTPPPASDGMTLAIIEVPQYPSLPPENAKRIRTATVPNGRPDIAVRVRPERNVRFTMRDIGVLKKRIENLEYYTSLSMLETAAKNVIISDGAGNNRFKNGILVDNFTGHKIGDTKLRDYKIAVDQKTNELIPSFKMDDVQLQFVSSNSSGVAVNAQDKILTVGAGTYSNGETISVGAASGKLVYQVGTKLYLEQTSGTFNTGTAAVGGSSGTSATVSAVESTENGKLITLDYTHDLVIQQPYSSMTRNIAGASYQWVGEVTLDPDTDYWVDTTTAPEVIIDTSQNSRAIEELANAIGTVRGDFINIWRDRRVETINLGGNRQGDRITQTTTTEQEVIDIETHTGEDQRQSIGENIIDLSIQPFLRSRIVRVSARAVKPNTRLFAFFDNTDVNSFVTPANSTFANTGNEGSILQSDANGEFYGLFRIPNEDTLRFRAGDTLPFRLTDSSTNTQDPTAVTTCAFGYYHGFGQSQFKRETVLSTRPIEITTAERTETRTVTTSRVTNIRAIHRGDPLAQTFKVGLTQHDGLTERNGGFLTKVDLYFGSRDDDTQQPVIVEVRETHPSTGYTTNAVVPFSKVITPFDKVNVSTDGSAPTPIVFPTPIFLEENKNYSLVIRPGATNPNYTIFTARLGETDTLTGERIVKNPMTGSLQLSSDDLTYSIEQQEDIKCKLYFANFGTEQSGTAVLKNRDKEFLVLGNTSGNFSTIGEAINGETTMVTAGALSANVGDRVVGDTSGANGEVTFSSGTTVRIKGIGIVNKFQASERVYKYASATGANTGTNSTVSSLTTPSANVYFSDFTNFSNTHLHVSNTIGTFVKDTFIEGQTSGTTGRIVSLRNIPVDEFYAFISKLDLKTTTTATTARLAATESSRDTEFRNVNVNGITNFSGKKFILSKSNETSSIGGEKSSEFRVALANQGDFRVSPALDDTRSSIIAVENIINNDDTGETSKSGGNAQARYITKIITLAEGQDAEDLRAFLTVYKTATSTIKMYYKILHAEDSDTIGDRSWVEMTQTTANTQVSSTEDRDDFVEYEFNVPTANLSGTGGAIQYTNTSGVTYTGFKRYCFKIVLLSTSTQTPPRVKNLRAIAMQA